MSCQRCKCLAISCTPLTTMILLAYNGVLIELLNLQEPLLSSSKVFDVNEPFVL